MTWQWLSARTGTLPLALAGPILRRVELGLLRVWVATQAAQSVTSTVQADRTQVATNVTFALPNGQPAIQLGDHLFVALLTASAPASAQLKPGVLYYYELTFTSPSGTSTSFASAMSAPFVSAMSLDTAGGPGAIGGNSASARQTRNTLRTSYGSRPAERPREQARW